MARLLLLTIVLIVYASLYPWHLRPALDTNALFIDAWPSQFTADTIRDIAVNIVVYLPVGLFAFATFGSIWRSLLLGFALSTLIEFAQIFIATRVPSLLDITTDTLGTLIGVAAGLWWDRTKHRPALRPDSLFLVCCWVLYQCFPCIPRLARPSFVIRSRPEDILLFFAEAIALVLLVQRRRRMLAALFLLVPLKAFIYTRTATLPEILCCAIAWFVSLRAPIAAVLLGIALVVHGLSPFHFQTEPHPFYWLPFQASLYSEWEPALIIMLGKVLAYGMLLWLIRESGLPLVLATTLTAALLAAIEVTQMYLPGRSSEIVDPLIAVILGWVYWSLGQAKTPAPRADGRSVC